MMIATLMLPLLAMLAVPEQAPAPASAPAYKGRTDVISVQASDPEMNAAIDRARAELPKFFARLAAPRSGESDFAVKFNLTPRGDAEFIWANELKRSGDHWTGTLQNTPIAAGFKLGQRVAIREDDIVDWNYYANRTAQGHQTTRVLLNRMAPDQAAQIQESLGW